MGTLYSDLGDRGVYFISSSGAVEVRNRFIPGVTWGWRYLCLQNTGRVYSLNIPNTCSLWVF